MSKTYRSASRTKMCSDKHRFKTQSSADKAAWFVSQKYGKQTRAYYCPICKGFHLTTQV